MRKTAAGDLLKELTKSNKSFTAADSIRNKLLSAIPDPKVKCLRQTADIEIVDLDEFTTEEEVLEAIRKSLGSDDLSSNVKVTGIWSTRSGQQMAKAQVPCSAVEKLSHIRWLAPM